MRIVHVVGARPNFMKVAPVFRALERFPKIKQVLVHTGQHYDPNMSDVFFDELEIPKPDYNLAVGSSSHAQQTAEILVRFEPIVQALRPDLVVVYGDVNSTIAATLVCAKLGVRVAHVEAGLRSFDRRMPEEINRLVTDRLSDLLFTPSLDGDQNLAREGVDSSKVKFVGNVMIDTLIRMLGHAHQGTLSNIPARYGLVTLHRPSNVDIEARLFLILEALAELSVELPIVFPVHPRTSGKLQEWAHRNPKTVLHFLDPLPYLEFLHLQRQAVVVITDSGGIQEETTFLGIPCLTLRDNTERPVTVTTGTNKLIGDDMELLKKEVRSILSGTYKTGKIPEKWDGHAGERIADILMSY